MTNPSKAFWRLGMVGAAAVVGLVPVALGGSAAFAAVSNANLSVTPTTTGSASQAVNTFTTGTALATGNTITITSNDSSGCVIALPATAALSTAATPTNYAVTFTPPGGAATSETGTATDNGTNAACAGGSAAYTGDFTGVTISLNTPIPAGSAVTVTINNAQNPPSPSGVYFADSTTTDTQVINTNVVSIGNAAVSTPTVTSVNPTAYSATAGEPFTVTGTNFSNTYNAVATPSPVVCFVESTTTAPAVSSAAPATDPCGAPVTGAVGTPLAGVITSAPATNVNFSAGEIQGTSPTLTAGHSYNVVVYNYNGGASTPTYTPASATSSQTLVGVATGLNFVPESGVRIVDSRNGLNLPRGNLTPNTPTAIPLGNFAQTLALPTNLPAVGGYTGLDVNVTAVAPASGGNIQIWAAAAGACPNGLTAPIKPVTVNFQPPQDTNNSQVIPVPAGDTQLCVQNNGAAVSLVVDLTGYTTGATYTAPAGAARLLDTRPATQTGAAPSLLGPLSSGKVYRFQTGLAAGTQVALNVADVAPTSQGYLTIFPEPASGAPSASGVPNTAVTNFIPNTDSSAMVVTTIGTGGFMDLYSGGTGQYNVVVDELGSFAGSSLKTVSLPFRIYDSRPGPNAAASTVTVVASPSGSGSDFVPGGALGVMGNLSDINPAGQGYVVTFPAGGVVPGTASIAHFPSQTRNTNNAVALNPGNGSFSIYTSGAATNSTFDVTAYIS